MPLIAPCRDINTYLFYSPLKKFEKDKKTAASLAKLTTVEFFSLNKSLPQDPGVCQI